VPGASWIFARSDLDRALLATRMNGAPLPADHGAPVRLIVPGWYGCACIKWVNRIELVTDERRRRRRCGSSRASTHQVGVASSWRATTNAASSTRPRCRARREVDRRRPRVLSSGGIIWGGSKPTNALSIRFKSGTPWTRVENCRCPSRR
jgi:DMSO/TMAO reductase YedYZ molybdopterin-dependent catalytic subunit